MHTECRCRCCCCCLLLFVIVYRMAKLFVGSLNLVPVFSFSSLKHGLLLMYFLAVLSHLRPRFAYITTHYILGNDGHALSQGGRHPTAAKPPLYYTRYLVQSTLERVCRLYPMYMLYYRLHTSSTAVPVYVFTYFNSRTQGGINIDRWPLFVFLLCNSYGIICTTNAEAIKLWS